MSCELESRFSTARDGLVLHYLDARPDAETSAAVAVCLPGLARTADDFKPLMRMLAERSATPRRVLAFDYRGRGLSDFDPDWRHYDLETERRDFLDILDRLGIESAHFIGTSRGGLHVFGLATNRRAMIRGVVLNDIGPVIELDGLTRIKGYVGKVVAPRSFDDAIESLKTGGGKHFDGLSAAEWRYFAETTFGCNEATLAVRYDPQLCRTLDALDLTRPLPQSWNLFDKLAGAPVLTIRGAKSDLLSVETFQAMGRRWAASETTTVPGQGHAPLLAEEATLERIDAFLTNADRTLTPVGT